MDTEPQKLDTAPHVVSWSAQVPAAAADLWALVANPHRHHEFDGSGTVRSQAVGAHELTEGARFTVHMRKFGLPYRLPLRVTRAVPPTAERPGVVEWKQPTGHRWRWEFQPMPDADPPRTLVTETYDASRQLAPARFFLSKVAGVEAENSRSIRRSLHRLQSLFS